MGIGFRELLVILVIVILVWGTKRLPNIMEDVAKGIKSFKQGLRDDDGASAQNTPDKSNKQPSSQDGPPSSL